ncbi:MAG: Gfo/Idh/MocA family oxidoreductase [Dehalococcoidia bacterium]
MASVEGCELAIVADADAGATLARDIGCEATTRWEEIVEREDVEAVLVCTPPDLHAPIALAAMRAGKHVLCEKPLALTVVEAEEMVREAEARAVVLKCGFNLRHHPGIERARAWLYEGRLGEPVFLRCRYGVGGRSGFEQEWRAAAEVSGGGQLMDQGVHVLDLSRWFLGEFAVVSAMLTTGFWDIAPLEDNAFVTLTTAGRQVASLHVSQTQWRNLFSLEVYGREGYAQVEGLGGSYGVERAVFGRRDPCAPFAEEVIEYRGPDASWANEWREFVAAIREERAPLGSGRDGLEALRLAAAAYEANESGATVKLRAPVGRA